MSPISRDNMLGGVMLVAMLIFGAFWLQKRDMASSLDAYSRGYAAAVDSVTFGGAVVIPKRAMVPGLPYTVTLRIINGPDSVVRTVATLFPDSTNKPAREAR